MEILARDGDWTTTDEERLAEFLNTPSGRRFIPTLASRIPELLPSGDTNAILIRSGEVRAYQAIIENVLLLAHPPVASGTPMATSGYPAPEDDTAWNDGQKLIIAVKDTQAPAAQ